MIINAHDDDIHPVGEGRRNVSKDPREERAS
jgi:hypothetical protein